MGNFLLLTNSDGNSVIVNKKRVAVIEQYVENNYLGSKITLDCTLGDDVTDSICVRQDVANIYEMLNKE